MTTKPFARVRRWAGVLLLATGVALATAAAPLWLDTLTGSALTPAAFACQPQSSGCG